MNEQERQEFSSLITKSESETLSYEELQRLNELHNLFIQQCYQTVLQSEEEKAEMRNELDEYNLVTIVLLNFIEQQGLTDEMQDYFNATIDEVVEKTMTADIVQ